MVPTTPSASADQPYVYILIRTDLSLAQQLVQSNHASLQAGFEFDKPNVTSNLVVLSVPDKPALLAAAAHLSLNGIEHHLFYEPDFEMGHSSLATQPLYRKKDRYCLKKYPLYGSAKCSSQH